MHVPENMKLPPKAVRLLPLLYFFAFTLAFINTAWVTEDAFITFRAVDNFLKGYGPVWNVGERVQVYTHPLWYALLVIGIGIFKHHYWVTLALSYVCLLGTLYLFLKIARHGDMKLGIIASIALLLSRAFIDYSSSGLENPLLHVLLCAYVLVALTQQDAARRFFQTSALYGLLFLTRPDSIFLVTPASLWMLWQAYRASGWRRTAKLAVLAITPVLAWEAFSLIYYGSLVPNTALAKTNVGYPRSEMLARGPDYFVFVLEKDPVTLILILLAGYYAFFSKRNALPKIVMGGVLLQILYIFFVGADYMMGRFLTLSVLASAIALSLLRIEFDKRSAADLLRVVGGGGIVTILFFLCFLCVEHIPGYERRKFVGQEASLYGVIDERKHYHKSFGMLPKLKKILAVKAITHNSKKHEDTQLITQVRAAIGYGMWKAGEKHYTIDMLALSNPYLARIPAVPKGSNGHYPRYLPEGYIESLISGRNAITDHALAALYDDVASATRGSLFGKGRWKSIWRLNTGYYKIHLGFPRHTLHTNIIPVPPAFSPFLNRNHNGANRVMALQYALAYDDAPSVQRFIATSQRDQKWRADLTHAASGLWLLIIRAAQRGQDGKLKAVLAAGADVNALDGSGNSALGIAAALNDAASVRVLLEHGANINMPDKHGQTALMKAARHGDIDAAKLLLAHGADMVEKGKDEKGRVHGRTALMYAAWHGQKEMVQFLIERGINVNTAGALSGETALINAARRGHIDIVRMLLDKGADVNAVMKNSATALGLALSGKAYTPRNNKSERANMVELLLAHDADVSAALTEVARRGSLESLKFLTAKGANVNFVDAPFGATPLMHAAWHGHKDIVAFLLAEKAAVNPVNKSGWTALCHAAAKGHTAIVKLLIKKGADIDKANNAGWTPLMEASLRGHVDTVRLLLAGGADVHLKNKNGWTALCHAAAKGNTAIVKLLIKKGADIDKANNAGWTPLMEASLRGHADTVRLLLAGGADVHLKNKKGETALRLATLKKHGEVAAMLRAAGASER